MDYSSLSKLLTCPRQFYHSEIERLAPTSERINRRFGDAWHLILYKHGEEGMLDEVDIHRILDTIQWEDVPGDYRNRAKLIRGYRRYVERYEKSFVYVQREQGFKMELGLYTPWEGKTDAVVIWDSNEGKGKELWVVDYKTTSVLRADWVEFYRNSNQFKGYYLNAKNEWPELAGVVVDVYHATKGAKSGKTFEELEGNRFYRLPIRYEEFTLLEAQRDFAVGTTAALMYKEVDYYPKNTSACHQFGVPCAFLELCDAQTPDSRERLKKTYGVNTFDPHAPVKI